MSLVRHSDCSSFEDGSTEPLKHFVGAMGTAFWGHAHAQPRDTESFFGLIQEHERKVGELDQREEQTIAKALMITLPSVSRTVYLAAEVKEVDLSVLYGSHGRMNAAFGA